MLSLLAAPRYSFPKTTSACRTFATSTPAKMKVVAVPVRDDNYAYLLIDTPSQRAAFVDPYDLKAVQAAAEREGVKDVLGCITTHHHFDHSGGNEAFAKAYPSLPVWGGSTNVPALTKKVSHGDTFTLGDNINVTGHATPCHTQDSICFFVEDKQGAASQGQVKRGVFTGDTLFISGCGRFFEGTAEEMHKALNVTLSALPSDTVVFCGHEYTASNVAFSSHILPSRPAVTELLQAVKTRKNGGVTTGVYTIGQEKEHNVFMLVSDKEVMEKVGGKDEVDTMQKLREAKNNFKANI